MFTVEKWVMFCLDSPLVSLSDESQDCRAAQSANECLMRCFQGGFGGVMAEAVGVQGDASQRAPVTWIRQTRLVSMLVLCGVINRMQNKCYFVETVFVSRYPKLYFFRKTWKRMMKELQLQLMRLWCCSGFTWPDGRSLELESSSFCTSFWIACTEQLLTSTNSTEHCFFCLLSSWVRFSTLKNPALINLLSSSCFQVKSSKKSQTEWENYRLWRNVSYWIVLLLYKIKIGCSAVSLRTEFIRQSWRKDPWKNVISKSLTKL